MLNRHKRRNIIYLNFEFIKPTIYCLIKAHIVSIVKSNG